MRRYINFTEFDERYLNKAQIQLSGILGDNIDEIIAPFTTFKWERDFINSVPSIFRMITLLGNQIDRLIDLQIDNSIDNMLQSGFLKNYYSITEDHLTLTAKRFPKEFKFFPSNLYLERLNALNVGKKKIEIKEYISTAEETYQLYLDFIRHKGFDYKNNAINRDSIMKHQIKKHLQSNCFIQDILLEILISNIAKINSSFRYSFEEINKHYGLSEDFDVEEAIERMNKHQLPFDHPNMTTGSRIGVDSPGKDIQMFFMIFPGLLDLLNFTKPQRNSCAYQNMQMFSEFITAPNLNPNRYENMCLFEKITGVNHCIHFFYFLLEYRDDDCVLDFIDYFYIALKKYPNFCTRIYLIDEILCLLNKNESMNDLFRVSHYLDSYLPLYTKKYELMNLFVSYYVNKINIERNNPKFNLQYIINSLLKEFQKNNLPWTLHSEGIFINSEAQRYAHKYFATSRVGKDKITKFYKSVQNEILILNQNNYNKG